MVGAVIVSHSCLSKELISTAEYIVGKMDGIVAVSIDCKMDALEARKVISEAMSQVERGEGVLILTDFFGGSPSNVAFSFLNKNKVEVITGVNLPMILTFRNKREGESLIELAKSLQFSGTRSIVVVRGLMKTKGAFRKISIRK